MIGGPGFIYVRVPRTASTSHVAFLLDLHGEAALERRGRQHEAALGGPALWGADWETRHTYGFIRNPWDWLVSMYNANLSEAPLGKESLPGRGPLGSAHRANMGFDDWVMARRTTPIDWLVDPAGALAVDEVRRFEDFIRDAPAHLSGRPHPPYREWFSPQLAAHVARLGAREIEIGGYEF